MAIPKRKLSRTRSRVRHGKFAFETTRKLLNKINLVECAQCGEKKIKHTVCANCDTYKGKKIADKKTVKTAKTTKAEKVVKTEKTVKKTAKKTVKKAKKE